MHVLLVNYEYPPIGGGAATATQAIARCMIRRNHAVTVLTSGIGERAGVAVEDGVHVWRLRTGRTRADRASIREMMLFVWHALVALRRLDRAARPDAAIVFFSIPCGPLGWLLRARHGVPYVLSLRGGDVPGFLRELVPMHRLLAPLRRACLRRASAVVANSPSLVELAETADGGEVRMIPNGVDTDAFFPGPGSPNGAYEFIFVGRLTEQKRLALTLDAFKRLHDSRREGESFTLSVVGDGPLRESLHAKADALGIGERVTWHGWVARDVLAKLYRRADCLVQASNIEGMSNTVLEGMASGLPIIASEGPGNRDVVVHESNGILFPVDDLDALHGAMRALSADRAVSRRYGEAARAAAVSRHSWAATTDAYLALLGAG